MWLASKVKTLKKHSMHNLQPTALGVMWRFQLKQVMRVLPMYLVFASIDADPSFRIGVQPLNTDSSLDFVHYSDPSVSESMAVPVQ